MIAFWWSLPVRVWCDSVEEGGESLVGTAESCYNCITNEIKRWYNYGKQVRQHEQRRAVGSYEGKKTNHTAGAKLVLLPLKRVKFLMIYFRKMIARIFLSSSKRFAVVN